MEKSEEQTNVLYNLLIVYCLLLLILGLMIEGPRNILLGMCLIIQSPSQLLSDYIEVANLGSAFFNSGLLTIVSIFIAKKVKASCDGRMIAALFSVSGFSFFGKNIYNSIPIFIGVWWYSKITRKPLRKYITIGYFGSALSPVVSYLTFGLNASFLTSLFLGITVGILIGFLLPILSAHCRQFHKGYSLYNVGFTCGLMAMIITSIFRLFEGEIEPVDNVSIAYSSVLFFFLLTLFVIIYIIGLHFSKQDETSLKKITELSGRNTTNFIGLAGIGRTLINMGRVGLLLTSFIFLMGGSFSGPIVGAVLTVVGFSACGNHLKNSLPILIGVILASIIAPIHERTQSTVIMAAIFGTSLAPISGSFGALYGVIAGFVHLALVTNITYLHAGLNLYNNGFSCGFVAAFLVPFFESINLKNDVL